MSPVLCVPDPTAPAIALDRTASAAAAASSCSRSPGAGSAAAAVTARGCIVAKAGALGVLRWPASTVRGMSFNPVVQIALLQPQQLPTTTSSSSLPRYHPVKLKHPALSCRPRHHSISSSTTQPVLPSTHLLCLACCITFRISGGWAGTMRRLDQAGRRPGPCQQHVRLQVQAVALGTDRCQPPRCQHCCCCGFAGGKVALPVCGAGEVWAREARCCGTYL